MHCLFLLAGIAVVQSVGAVMNNRNLTMQNGTVVSVQLPPGIQFVPELGPGEPTSGITKCLSWHPGNGDVCKSAYGYPFVNKTSDGSPWVSHCQEMAETALDPQNQGYFVALQGADLRANGDWCRLMYHGSCVFGIKSKVFFGAKVGSEDIGNTIIDAMNQAGEHLWDKMQYEGTFKCKSSVEDTATVRWAIFHS